MSDKIIYDDIDYYDDIQKNIPGVSFSSGYRTPEYQEDMRRRGYKPDANSGHLGGSKLDLIPPAGKSWGWLRKEIATRYPEAVINNNERDHLDVAFPGYNKAPVLGGAAAAGITNPNRDAMVRYDDEPHVQESVKPLPKQEVVNTGDPLAGAAVTAGNPNDPLTQQLMHVQPQDSVLNDSVAGGNLGEAPEGGFFDRVSHAANTQVLPDYIKDIPLFGAGLEGAVRIPSIINELIRGTPLEGLALAFPLGGAELGGFRPHVAGDFKLASDVEAGWKHVLDTGSKDDILKYAAENKFNTTPDAIDPWIESRHGRKATVDYQEPGLEGSVTDTSPDVPNGGVRDISRKTPHADNDAGAFEMLNGAEKRYYEHVQSIPDRSSPESYNAWLDKTDELAAAADRSRPKIRQAANENPNAVGFNQNIVEQPKLYEPQTSGAAQGEASNDLTGNAPRVQHEQLPQFLQELNTVQQGVDELTDLIVKYPDHADKPFWASELDRLKKIEDSFYEDTRTPVPKIPYEPRNIVNPNDLDGGRGKTLPNPDLLSDSTPVEPRGTPETLQRVDGSGRLDTQDVTTYTPEEAARLIKERTGVDPTATKSVDNVADFHGNRMAKYEALLSKDKPTHAEFDDAIDYLDEAYAQGADVEALQDKLMARQNKMRADAEPANSNVAETPLEKAQREAFAAEDAYNEHVGWGKEIPTDDHPMYANRNSKRYKAWTAERKALEDVKVQKAEAYGQALAADKPPAPKARTIKSFIDELVTNNEGSVPRKGKEPKGEGPEVPPEEPVGPHDELIKKFTRALDEAGSARRAQRDLTHEEMKKKAGQLAQIRKETSGKAGYYQSLAQLKGERAKVDFEGVEGKFTPEEVNQLFDAIKEHPSMARSEFDPINAQRGLAKLLEGKVPGAHELGLLAKVFPKDFVRAAVKHRMFSQSMTDRLGDALNLPRTLMSSFDLSAPFRQGIFMVGRKEFWTSFAGMFKQFGSEKAFQAVIDDIRTRPTFGKMQDSGLALADIDGIITNREELFMSSLAGKIPVIGRGVRASERAYTGFLNKLRADVFDNINQKYMDAGIEQSPKQLDDMAKFINNATGRGDIHGLTNAGPMINGAFFSPRLMASRVQMLNPVMYYKLDPIVRREALKSLIAFGGIATTVLALAKVLGADVETDPRSSEFAKIKIGNTRRDVTGGFGQYITLGARLATNQTKTGKGQVHELGKRYGSDTRLGVSGNFVRNKLSPIGSFVGDYLAGKNVIGEKFELGSAVAQRFIPMILQDYYELVKEEGVVSASAGIVPDVFGVSTSTYDVNKPRPGSKPKYNDAVKYDDGGVKYDD